MKRLSIFGLFAIAAIGATSFSDDGKAQQRLTKDQLVGTWALVSCTGANGGTPAFCVNPNGRMILGSDGRYMYSIAARGRPKCSGACGRAQMSSDQYKAAAQGFVSNFGNWSFNEADQILTANIEAALFPAAEGTDAKGRMSLVGDELHVTYQGDGGGPGRTDVWRRAR